MASHWFIAVRGCLIWLIIITFFYELDLMEAMQFSPQIILGEIQGKWVHTAKQSTLSSMCHSRVLNRPRAPLFTKLVSRKFRPRQKKYIYSIIHNYGCKRINLLNANTHTPPLQLRNLVINFCARNSLMANANEPIWLGGVQRTIQSASQVACNFNLCTNYTFQICFYERARKKSTANLQYLFLFVVVVVDDVGWSVIRRKVRRITQSEQSNQPK